MTTRLASPPGNPGPGADGHGRRRRSGTSASPTPPAAAASSPLQAVDGVTFAVAEHEIVALVGPSGCGKTTLLELVCGLQAPDSGQRRRPPPPC